MYSLAGYGSMVADRVRMDAYREAMSRSIKPGSIVVDLGAGAGIMSCLAAQMGAARVHAIEPDSSIEIARSIALANGLRDRIEFHQCLSSAVTLPEPADVVVADLRGVLPAHTGNFRAIADARRRMLRPGGTLIPQRDTLWVSLAEAPVEYDEHLQGWSFSGLDLSTGRNFVANNWIKNALTADQLLSPPVQWAEINYLTVNETALAGSAKSQVLRAGTAHALSVWFDAELIPGVGFSNAPDKPRAIYGQAFFPLLHPVPVETGDKLAIDLRADLIGDDYTWTWQTAITTPEGSTRAVFRQSTFHGTPLSASTLRKRADTFVPACNQNAQIDRDVLALFGSGQNLREIAARIAASYPAHFQDEQAALDRVGALSAAYSE